MAASDRGKQFCSFCYASPAPKVCSKCHKRRYCCRECQILDWNKHGAHKHFCGIAGEVDHDFIIQESPGKGLGVFANRSFLKNEKIVVERPIVMAPNTGPTTVLIPETARPAFDALHPIGGSLRDKCLLNGIACGDDGTNHDTGVFITMSRVNHSCIGNSLHRYLPHRGVKILVASRDIAEGEEITFSYSSPTASTSARKAKLRNCYGFECFCEACQSPEIQGDLERITDLDGAILRFGSMGRIEAALRKGKSLLQIYDRLQLSSWLYHRTYYDMFQVAVTKRCHLKDGITYIRLAYEHCRDFADEDLDETKRMRDFMENPQHHRNYLLLG